MCIKEVRAALQKCGKERFLKSYDESLILVREHASSKAGKESNANGG